MTLFSGRQGLGVRDDQRVEATLDAYPDWKIPGHVISNVPTADRQKATVRVRIAFDQLDPRILPDMGIKVRFLEDESPATVAPPTLPESFYFAAKPPRRSGYLLSGLVWLFVGIGVVLALGAVAGEDVRLFGLIPIGVGVAFLIYYMVEGRKLPAGSPESPPAA